MMQPARLQETLLAKPLGAAMCGDAGRVRTPCPQPSALGMLPVSASDVPVFLLCGCVIQWLG